MKKINSIIMIIILLLSIGITKVYAAYSCNVDITCSNTSIKKGDTVELVVSVSNIDAGEGIAGFQALLNYDSNVFSNVELEKADNWEEPTLIDNVILMTTETGEATKENQELFKIKLTAKEDATDGSYEVSLTQIQIATDDYTGIVLDKDPTVKINVGVTQDITDDTDNDGKEDGNKPNTDDNQNGEEGNKPTTDDSQNGEQGTTNTDDDKKGEQGTTNTEDDKKGNQESSNKGKTEENANNKDSQNTENKNSIQGVQTGDIILYVVIILVIAVLVLGVTIIIKKSKKQN